MKTASRLTISALVLMFLFVQSATPARATSFEPFDRWSAALKSGSESALAALYSKIPPAQLQTQQGTVQDPAAEANYWASVMSKNPTDVNVKVLDIEHRQAGVIEVVLRVEMMFPTDKGPQPVVAGIHQVWQEQGNNWSIVFTRRDGLGLNPHRTLPEPTKPNTDLYAPPEDAPKEIAVALAEASKDHKRVILVFGANWCYDCHVLDTAFHSKDIAPLVNANYHVVHVNVGDEDKNLDLAEKYGVPLKKGIPGLAVLNANGTVVYSQKEGEFENSVRIGPADVTTFLKKWAPPHNG